MCRSDGIRVHECRDLDPDTHRRIDQVPVTGIARTLVDVAGISAPSVLEDAIYGAIDRRLVTWSNLQGLVDDLARRGRTGPAALRSIIDRNLEVAAPESKLESALDRLLRSWGLPQPIRQYEVRADGLFVARLDFAYPVQRLAIETDGCSVHARRQAFERDHERRNRIRLAGWQLLIYTHAHVHRQPTMVRAQIEAALAVG